MMHQPKLRPAATAALLVVLLIFPSASIAQDEPEDQPPSREEMRDEVLEQYKGTPLGSILEWLLDEDRKYFIVPVVSTGPDTGWMLGLAWYHTDIFGKDKRDMILGAITTQSGQNNFALAWTEPGIPLEDGRIAISVFFSENPMGGIRYFGLGNRTRYEDVASNYRADSIGFGLGYIYEFSGHWTMWTGYSYSENEFDDPDEDFEMGGDDDVSRPLSKVHPEVFSSRAFQEGYKKGEVGMSISYDSRSRERLLRLGPGFRFSAGGSWADKDLGGDYDWASWNLSWSQYLGLTETNNHILAYRGSYTHAWGQIPFNQYPGLSSGTNRGYYSGRFLGENKLEGNLEYRWYMTRHFGIAVFADSGKVFENGEDFEDALFTDYHPAFGGGIRIKVPPEIIFRIDYGTSHEQSNFYVTLGESF